MTTSNARPTIGQAVSQLSSQLANHSSSARLDTELLLAYVLNKPRSIIYSHPEIILTAEHWLTVQRLAKQRCQGLPLAYITGHKEFWSLTLQVSPATLIPRPETEQLVAQALQLLQPDLPCRVADLGTGSGAIAIALAYHRPHWIITATDNSVAALALAQRNAEALALTNIRFLQGHWCDALAAGEKWHAIISNPPYLAADDPHLAQLSFEPSSALIAQDHGLADLRTIINQATAFLMPSGWLMLEHGHTQAAAVASLLATTPYYNCQQLTDLAGIKRITIAQTQGR
jgi:release factor glutamine methyltransferase